MLSCSLRVHGIAGPCHGFGRFRRKTVQRFPHALRATGAQFPPYDIVHDGNGYSLRMYSPYTVVRTIYVRRDEGYLALGSYFSGENEDGIRFRETQPVTMLHSAQVR